MFIRNDSDSDMYVSYTDTATNTSVLKLSKDDVLYENKYKGVISAIWSALGSGFARILDITTTINSLNLINGLNLWLDSNDITTINKKNAAVFNGSNFLLPSGSLAFNYGDEDFSVTGWVKINGSIGSFESVFGKYTNSSPANQSYRVSKGASEQIQFVISNGTLTNVVEDLTNTITDGEWFFFAAVHDSVNDLIKISVNGNTFVTTAHSGGANSSYGAAMYIGGIFGNGMNGSIDDLVFHGEALTQSQVTTLYNGGAGLDMSLYDQTNVDSYFDFNELSGTRYDLVGSNDLTESGGAVTVEIGKVQGTVNDNDNVFSWIDKSSNNYIFNQSTGANQPIYNANGFGLNNRASLDFRNSSFLDIVSGSLS